MAISVINLTCMTLRRVQVVKSGQLGVERLNQNN